MKIVEPIKLDPFKVDEILDDAKEKGFESVIVFGRHGKKITVMSSGDDDITETVGALELAKFHLWSNL
jgi:hypothetical protein